MPNTITQESVGDTNNMDSVNNESKLITEILFLEQCLLDSQLPPNLDYFAHSHSAKARKLALKLAILHKLDTSMFRIDDPHFSVRSEVISHTFNSSSDYSAVISTTKKYVTDSNPCVRLAILNTLQTLDLDAQSQESLIYTIIHLINDPCVSVRILFCKVLRKFTLLNKDILLQMFDKEGMGTFIYGAEDESLDVRKELISTLEHIIVPEIASAAFEYLCDMLNDDSCDLRSKCVVLLAHTASSYVIERRSEEVSGIFHYLNAYPAPHQNRKYILKILECLYYKDIDIVRLLIKYLDNTTVLRTLNKILRRNLKIFEEALKNTGRFLFSTPNQRQYCDIEYLCDALIISSVYKRKNIAIEDSITVKDGVIVQDGTLLKKDIEKAKGFIRREKPSELLTLLKSIREAKKTGSELNIPRMITSAGKFLKKYLQDPSEVQIESIPYKFRFNRRKFERILRRSKKDDCGKLAERILCLFIRHRKYREAREYSFRATVRACPGFPTELDVEIGSVNGQVEAVKFVVESEEGILVYDLNKKIKILIENEGRRIPARCFIGAVKEEKVIKLSKELSFIS